MIPAIVASSINKQSLNNNNKMIHQQLNRNKNAASYVSGSNTNQLQSHGMSMKESEVSSNH
jgi:hypothetical protein